MSIPKIGIKITIHGSPSEGIPTLTDKLELVWDLDEIPDERERVRSIFSGAWSELYDDRASVIFSDECPDCLRLKVNCLCLKGLAEEKVDE